MSLFNQQLYSAADWKAFATHTFPSVAKKFTFPSTMLALSKENYDEFCNYP